MVTYTTNGARYVYADTGEVIRAEGTKAHPGKPLDATGFRRLSQWLVPQRDGLFDFAPAQTWRVRQPGGAQPLRMTTPEPDRDQLQRFVETLFKNADPGTFVSLRAFRDDLNQVWRPDLWTAIEVVRDSLDNIVSAAFRLAGQAAEAPEPVCFACPICTFRTANRAAEKDIAQGLTISVDCDAAPERARERLEDLLGPSTLVVVTGGEWIDPETGEIQSKEHLHWRLATPASDFAGLVRLKELRRVMADLVGADPTGAPISHPYRWPGSWYRKPCRN
jgi:hypothetical protein